MREIKFRGKSAETGKWYYGDLITFKVLGITQYIINSIVVEPNSIGMRTSYKDSENEAIYEGDIIQAVTSDISFNENEKKESVKVGNIYYDDHSDGMWWDYGKASADISELYENNPKKLGNIHDNPELLEKEGKDA